MSNQIQALRHAVSRQRWLAGDLNGRVHSVFRHAVHFLMDDNCFVTLMLSGKPLCPEGIVVSPDAFLKQTAGILQLSADGLLPFKQGEAVCLKENWLLSKAFAIDLNGAESVELSLSRCAVSDVVQQGLTQWLPVQFDKHGLLTGLRRDVCCDHETISSFREALLETLSQSDIDRSGLIEIFSRQLNQFVGLGEGLTPSGDDFLVGLLWALWVGEADRLPGFETFLYALRSILHKTNDISAQMLWFAIRKRFTEPLISLARVSDPTDCAEAFKRIAAFGHTSGFDTLCGLLVGLKTTERIAHSFLKSAPTASNHA